MCKQSLKEHVKISVDVRSGGKYYERMDSFVDMYASRTIYK